MKYISVTGGKGGTGKSTVAILLSYYYLSMGKRVILADCDVECPNDHIILGRKLNKRKLKTYAVYPQIDTEKCDLCGKCIEHCRQNAMYKINDSIKVEDMLCNSCGVCFYVCPKNAIGKKKVVTGEIFEDDINDHLKLITGRSKVKIRETSPIVRELKSFVKKYEDSYDICITDTAAGTHCTVIAALEDSDDVYAVTEPTPLGLHDLKLILELLDVLSLSKNVVINKSNLGKSSDIIKMVKKYNGSIYSKIPYDKKLEQIYMKGEFSKYPDLYKLLNTKHE